MKRIFRPSLAALGLSLAFVLSCMAAPANPVTDHTTVSQSQYYTVDVAGYLARRDQLCSAGYLASQTEELARRLTADEAARAASLTPTQRLVDYARLDYFHAEYMERYAAYGQLHPELGAQDVVTYVNIGLDGPAHTSSVSAAAPCAVDVLVNKYNHLTSDFSPELVQMRAPYTSLSSDRLHPTAYEWFVRMADAARAEGLSIYSVSAYRSYHTQKTLYARYAARDGEAAADRYSAHAGYSEHQTGLALDVNAVGSRYHFEDSDEYAWLKEHCWDYGFILRYPQGKTAITGFIFEPWHYRYVGVELARQIRDSGLTYDEFIARLPATRPDYVPACDLPAIQLDGRPLALDTLTSIDRYIYLSASELAQALGWQSTLNTDTLTVLNTEGSFTLSPRAPSLTHTAAVYDGQLYMELYDLLDAFDVTYRQEDLQLLLSSRPAEEGWPFSDVPPYHTYYDAAIFAWKHGLFAGTSPASFSPDASMTRGMAVTVLRKLDQTNAGPATPFSDVMETDWYFSGVAWACTTGLVAGFPDGTFRPNEVLTREQAALILYQFAQHMGWDTYYTYLPETVPDADQVTDWAAWGVNWAWRESLLLPRPDGRVAPGEAISRGEMAHALMVLCQQEE